MTFVILNFGIVLTCLWLLKSLYAAYHSPLRAIPNAHFTVPFSPLWALINKWRGRENRARFKAHQRLGPVIRIGPNEIAIDSIEIVQQVYGGNFDKTAWYPNAFTGDETPVMFTMIPKEPHAERKRMLARYYSRSAISSSVEIQEMCHALIRVGLRNELYKWAGEGSTIDVFDKSKALMLDLTTAWMVGPSHRTNLLHDQHEAEKLLTYFNDSFSSLFWRSEFWQTVESLRKWGICIVPSTFYAARLNLRRWIVESCEAANGASAKDINANESAGLSGNPPIYARLRQSLAKSGLPAAKAADDASAEILDNLVASHDVAGVVMTYVLYEVSKRPSVQQALREELQIRFAHDSESFSDCFENMPFLDAVLMETLRFRSANPGPWPRRTPSPSCQIGSFGNIPAGTIVSASSYTLHRNPVVFPQPEEWIPERWINASKESHKDMMKWFWAFGSGARMCIGSHFAIHCIKAMAATIYSEFETHVVDDSGMEQIDGILAGPVGDKLLLKFRYVGRDVFSKEA